MRKVPSDRDVTKHNSTNSNSELPNKINRVTAKYDELPRSIETAPKTTKNSEPGNWKVAIIGGALFLDSLRVILFYLVKDRAVA